MKFTKTLWLTILFGSLGLGVNAQKALAHRYCEPAVNCHHNSQDQETIDYWTNYFFKLVRPEMRHKRIRAHQTLYRRELTEIRRVVANVIDRSCQEPHLNRYYSRIEQDAYNLDSKTARRRFVPRGVRLRHYPNDQVALHRLTEAEIQNAEMLRDRYDDWERAEYYAEYSEDGFSDRVASWDEELWAKDYAWQRTDDYFFNGLYQDLANAVFHARHPELSRNLDIKDNLNWATEWTFIRQYFASYEEDNFLKQHFIPLCVGKNY